MGKIDILISPEEHHLFNYNYDETFAYFTSLNQMMQVKVHLSKRQTASCIRTYTYVKTGATYLRYNNCWPGDCQVVTKDNIRRVELIKLVGPSHVAEFNKIPTDVWISIDAVAADDKIDFELVDKNWRIYPVSIKNGILIAEDGLPDNCMAISKSDYIAIPGFNKEVHGEYLSQSEFPKN